jgi:hypothetical protein
MQRLMLGALPPFPHIYSWYDALTYNEYLQHAQVLFVFIPLKLLAMVVKVFAVFSAN